MSNQQVSFPTPPCPTLPPPPQKKKKKLKQKSTHVLIVSITFKTCSSDPIWTKLALMLHVIWNVCYTIIRLSLTRSIQDSETSIDFVQGPPGSRRERVNGVL